MNVLVLFLAVFALAGCANLDERPVAENQQVMSAVVDVPDVGKQVLFARAQEWMAISYNNANAVIQSSNIKTGRIIGKGSTTAKFDLGGTSPAFWDYGHSVVIDTKDNKARVTFSKFISHESGYRPRYAYLYNPVKASIEPLLADFQRFMKTGGAQSVDSDW